MVVFLDVCSHYIVGLSTKSNMTDQLVIDKDENNKRDRRRGGYIKDNQAHWFLVYKR